MSNNLNQTLISTDLSKYQSINPGEQLFLQAQLLEVSGASSEIIIKKYKKSAMQGFAPAQNALGVFYMLGKHIDRNDDMAINWLTIAADQGYAHAKLNLAALLVEKSPKDPNILDYLYSAVLNGVAEAKTILAQEMVNNC